MTVTLHHEKSVFDRPSMPSLSQKNYETIRKVTSLIGWVRYISLKKIEADGQILSLKLILMFKK